MESAHVEISQSEKDAHDIANMMEAVFEKQSVGWYERDSKEYVEALKTVEELIDLAKKEPDMEKFKSGVLRTISNLSFVPGKAISSIMFSIREYFFAKKSPADYGTLSSKDYYDRAMWFKDLGVRFEGQDEGASGVLAKLKEEGKRQEKYGR